VPTHFQFSTGKLPGESGFREHFAPPAIPRGKIEPKFPSSPPESQLARRKKKYSLLLFSQSNKKKLPEPTLQTGTKIPPPTLEKTDKPPPRWNQVKSILNRYDHVFSTNKTQGGKLLWINGTYFSPTRFWKLSWPIAQAWDKI